MTISILLGFQMLYCDPHYTPNFQKPCPDCQLSGHTEKARDSKWKMKYVWTTKTGAANLHMPLLPILTGVL
jgi:hypothetical protein